MDDLRGFIGRLGWWGLNNAVDSINNRKNAEYYGDRKR